MKIPLTTWTVKFLVKIGKILKHSRIYQNRSNIGKNNINDRNVKIAVQQDKLSKIYRSFINFTHKQYSPIALRKMRESQLAKIFLGQTLATMWIWFGKIKGHRLGRRSRRGFAVGLRLPCWGRGTETLEESLAKHQKLSKLSQIGHWFSIKN